MTARHYTTGRFELEFRWMKRVIKCLKHRGRECDIITVDTTNDYYENLFQIIHIILQITRTVFLFGIQTKN